MNLKLPDIFVLLKLVALGKMPLIFNELAVELGVSSSEAHGGVQRSWLPN